ncbi:MAG: type IX secretion system protein PorQ [Bacteroidales bacterium]|nr:type IX secretion system protein PorQ [Bacteroidales bacterium]MCF8337666.1 type IX secretion system protein PorQ [Bacteroidales bacterium]
MKKSIFIIGLLFTSIVLQAQTGGNSTYEFLTLSNSARIAALGSDFAPIKDDDITLSIANPSLITEEMNNKLAMSFVDYYSDINYGFASYSKTFEEAGSFVGSVQYINYGKTTEANAQGDTLGSFSGNENAITLGWGRELDSLFSIGANVKLLTSFLHQYSSYGLAVDISGTYHNPEARFTASIIFKNIGRQIKSYEPGNNEPLPFEIQLGLSKRLKHLPFRYSIMFTNLQQPDLTYKNSSLNNQPNPFTGEVEDNDSGFGDKVMRHIVVGGEFMPTNNFTLRVGYNYRRRQEMKIESKLGTVGFSWGIGFRVSKFHFSYSRAAYHLVGSPNYITITTDLSKF